MANERKVRQRTQLMDGSLVIAVLATLWHVVASSSASQALARDGEALAPTMDVSVRVPIPELWQNPQFERTALLVLNTACPACLLSRPFYSELDRIVAATPGTRMVILSENPIPEVRAWLDESGIKARAVRIPSRKALGILATPTLVLAGNDGVITDMSIGMLSNADSDRFKARLRGASDAQPLQLPYSFSEVSMSEHRNVDSWVGPQLVDTRDRAQFKREHSAGALNIPEDELPLRAPAELRRSLPLFIDCRYGDQADCRLIARRLGGQGFSKITSVLR